MKLIEMKIIFTFGILLISMCVFSSCSVVMAAKKEGTNLSKVQQCKNRVQFISNGGKIVNSERMANGELEEVYRFKKERGSTARAVMHGVLDVATWGLWEVIGTPIEGCDTEEFFCIKVIYDNQNNVKNILLN